MCSTSDHDPLKREIKDDSNDEQKMADDAWEKTKIKNRKRQDTIGWRVLNALIDADKFDVDGEGEEGMEDAVDIIQDIVDKSLKRSKFL